VGFTDRAGFVFRAEDVTGVDGDARTAEEGIGHFRQRRPAKNPKLFSDLFSQVMGHTAALVYLDGWIIRAAAFGRLKEAMSH
jgi:hypothetical protein